ncbi:uncharacterized protein B0H18DRAFT_1124912 [Fomitopsis serialis]|uniref:uncharacterized protein n=1 Tax=Fomitopsis serialis TaxID=139415 RepID=UPI002007DD32|nr:uncharacterized protein B0H18DRAFT_1124912 [Neoantrodia serialis]KAH9915394.1 hypothetical protein B0H18DRAFT_1124912 [Neoantrodia serialis]
MSPRNSVCTGQRTPTLPQELCEAVIDFAWEYSSTLKTCSLVSRAWLPTSRMHKFSFVRFGEHREIISFQAIVSSPMLNSNRIPHLVRDLCLGKEEEEEIVGSRPTVLDDAELLSLLEKFTSVQTLRLENVCWSLYTILPAASDAVTVIASQVACLHLHWANTDDSVDLIHILSSSPRRSSVYFTGYTPQDSKLPWDRLELRKPINPTISIGRMVAHWDSYIRFYSAMLKTYAFRWPFAATIERLTLTEDPLGYPLHDVERDFRDLEDELLYTESQISVLRSGSRSREDDKGFTATTLNIRSIEISAPTILQSRTVFSESLTQLLYCRTLLAPCIRFVLDGSKPANAVPRQCAGLDHVLAGLAAEDPEMEISFDVQCTPERLADWIAAISACFPTLIVCGTRVEMVCSTTRNCPKGDRRPVAEHRWS